MAKLMFAQQVRKDNLNRLRRLIDAESKFEISRLKAIMSMNLGLSPESTMKYLHELEDFGVIKLTDDFAMSSAIAINEEVKREIVVDPYKEAEKQLDKYNKKKDGKKRTKK